MLSLDLKFQKLEDVSYEHINHIILILNYKNADLFQIFIFNKIYYLKLQAYEQYLF